MIISLVGCYTELGPNFFKFAMEWVGLGWVMENGLMDNSAL